LDYPPLNELQGHASLRAISLSGAQRGHLSRFDICLNGKSSQNPLHPKTLTYRSVLFSFLWFCFFSFFIAKKRKEMNMQNVKVIYA